jgi:hypothetical protein
MEIVPLKNRRKAEEKKWSMKLSCVDMKERERALHERRSLKRKLRQRA